MSNLSKKYVGITANTVEVSVIPATANDKHPEPTYNLRAANGSPIASFGQRMMNLDSIFAEIFSGSSWLRLYPSQLSVATSSDILGCLLMLVATDF
ncbi:unnamed protein product [Dicrocoelium dendriticum]|nr:unnamed protein product [Dicrocoelium dendriticum]